MTLFYAVVGLRVKDVDAVVEQVASWIDHAVRLEFQRLIDQPRHVNVVGALKAVGSKHGKVVLRTVVRRCNSKPTNSTRYQLAVLSRAACASMSTTTTTTTRDRGDRYGPMEWAK